MFPRMKRGRRASRSKFNSTILQYTKSDVIWSIHFTCVQRKKKEGGGFLDSTRRDYMGEHKISMRCVRGEGMLESFKELEEKREQKELLCQ